jgi:hypothetical protein
MRQNMNLNPLMSTLALALSMYGYGGENLNRS